MLAIRSQRELSCEPSDRRRRGQIQDYRPSEDTREWVFRTRQEMLEARGSLNNQFGRSQVQCQFWSQTQWEGSFEDFSHRSTKGLCVWSHKVLRPEGDHCLQTQGPRKPPGPGEGARWWPQAPWSRRGSVQEAGGCGGGASVLTGTLGLLRAPAGKN